MGVLIPEKELLVDIVVCRGKLGVGGSFMRIVVCGDVLANVL